jgi:DNA-binding MarR family transcriptional regulator
MAAERHRVPARNDPPALDDQIIIALRRISQAVDTYSRHLLQGFGLTAPQIGALRALQREQPIGPGQLAERLNLSAQTMVGIVSRLEQRGLVTRTRDPRDLRAFQLRITAEGKRLADSSLLSERFRKELSQLQEWERTQILSSLQRVAAMMNVAEVPPEPFFDGDAEATKESGET